jgi:hypothetical protein
MDLAIGGARGVIKEGLQAFKQLLIDAQKASLPDDVTDLMNLNTMEAAAVGLSRKASREALETALAKAEQTIGREPRQSPLFDLEPPEKPPVQEGLGLDLDVEPTPNVATAGRQTVNPLRPSSTVTRADQSTATISARTPRIDRFRMVPKGTTDLDIAAVPKDTPRSAAYRQRVLEDSGAGPAGLSVEGHPDPANPAATRTHVVYRGKDGQPVLVATLVKNDDGTLAVGNLASDPTKGLLLGRASKAVMDKLNELDAARPYAGISPDAENVLRKLRGLPPIHAVGPQGMLDPDLAAVSAAREPRQPNLEGLATPSEFEAVNNKIERGALGTVSSRTVPEGTGGRLSADALARIAEETGLSEDELRPLARAAFDRLDQAPEWLVRRAAIDAERQATHALAASDLDTGKALPVGFTPKLLDEARADFNSRTDLTAEQKATATRIATGLSDLNVTKSLHPAIDSGIMTPETADDLLARAAQAKETGRAGYAPISRVQDDVIAHIQAGYKQAGVEVPTQHFLYRINGSTKLSENPVQASAEKFAIIQNEAARNKAMQSLVNLRHENDYFSQAIRPLEEGEKALKGEGEVVVFEAGKPKRYALPEAVARSVSAADPQAVGVVGELMKATGGVFRAGTTMLNTSFAVPNVVKDVAGYAALSGRSPVAGALDPRVWADWAKGLKSYLTHDEWAQRYFNSGAAFSNFQANATGVNKLLTEGMAGTNDGVLKKLAGVTYHTTLGLAEKFNEALENATKIGAFRQMSESAARGESAISPSEMEVAWRTRNFGGSPDFARGGSKIREWNTIVPFLNANIQGLDRLAQFVKNNPKSAALVAGAATAQLLGLQSWNTSFRDPDGTRSWDRIPAREKQQNWILVLPGFFTDKDTGQLRHNYVKIPAAHETNVIRMPIQAALDESTRNVAGIGNALLSTVPTSPQIDPRHPVRSVFESGVSALNPLIREPAEQLWNRDSYRDMPIVSERLQAVRPEMQFSENTSPTARGVGQALGVSPARVEHVVQGMLGGLGAQGLSIADSLSGQQGQRTPVTDLPVLGAVTQAPVVGGVARPIVRRFVGGPASMNQQAKDIRDAFYDRLEQAKTLQASVRMKMQAGDVAGAKALLKTDEAKRLYVAANALSQVSTAAGAVHRSGNTEEGVLRMMQRLVSAIDGPKE